MKLLKEGAFFVAESTYEERHIPKAAGFYWSGKLKQWRTDDPEKALKLRKYADPDLQNALEEIVRHKRESLEASRATSADVELPRPEGLNYLPFQKAGIAFASGRPSTLIADEMGLGKTIQAIGVINSDPTIKRVLVICPSSLRLNWRRELIKWLVRKLSIGIIVKQNYPAGNPDIVIVNYDVLTKHKQALNAVTWDLLIADEVHYLKNPKAQRTISVFGKWNKDPEKKVEPIPARRKIFLTGTPIVNRPVELFPIIHALDPATWKSWHYYTSRYCDKHYNGFGWDVSGASNLEELQEKLRSSIMVRRLKSEVLTELPAKIRQVIELPSNGSSSAIASERAAYEAKEDYLSRLRDAVELAKASDNPDDYRAAVRALNEGSFAAFSEMSKVRHDTAVSKIPFVVEHLRDAIDSSGKVICFAHHKDVIDGIIKAIEKDLPGSTVRITGETPMQERDRAVQEFQNNPEVKLFVGNIIAAGVGLTLTASSHVVFAELDWVPGNVTQAEDRAHRIGQANSVLVQHIVLEGSLDAEIARAIVNKQEVIDKALDNQIDKSSIDIDLESLEAQVAAEVDEAATKALSRRHVEEQAAKLTDEQISAIHSALRIVARYCDGAFSEDGMGFSKADIRIGHSLARQNSLTPKQAILGRAIVLKYRRQYPEDLLELIAGKENV